MSFWIQHFIEDNLFCNTACADHCHGDDGDDDEFRTAVHIPNHDRNCVGTSLKQLPAINYHPRACQNQPPGQPQFSLPWADLNGTHAESLVTDPLYNEESRRIKASPIRSLLPVSDTSCGSTLNNLYRPVFMRGVPTKAKQYRPVPSDPIDVEVHRALGGLTLEAFELFALHRVEAGTYEIEGRVVMVYQSARGLLVHENEVTGASIADMPLQAYIKLVGNVAEDLQRLATDTSTTDDPFLDTGAPTIGSSSDGEDRYRAMQIACMQAKIREEKS